MLQIAICDDNAYYLAYSKNVIEHCLSGLNIGYELTCFSNAKDLLLYLKSNIGKTDVVFQNIELENQQSGIDIAKHINAIDANCKVVFLTAYLHYATDVYDINHCYYILKDELEDRIESVFKRIHFLIEQERPKRLVLKIKGKYVFCLFEDIKMIERNGRVSSVICQERTVAVAKSLDDIYSELDELRFVRCHNSYIVNLDYVSEWKRNAFVLVDNTQVPISRKYMEEVKRKFTLWT